MQWLLAMVWEGAAMDLAALYRSSRVGERCWQWRAEGSGRENGMRWRERRDNPPNSGRGLTGRLGGAICLVGRSNRWGVGRAMELVPQAAAEISLS